MSDQPTHPHPQTDLVKTSVQDLGRVSNSHILTDSERVALEGQLRDLSASLARVRYERNDAEEIVGQFQDAQAATQNKIEYMLTLVDNESPAIQLLQAKLKNSETDMKPHLDRLNNILSHEQQIELESDEITKHLNRTV